MLATVPGAAPVVPAAAQAVVPPAGWDGAEGAAPAIKDGVLQVTGKGFGYFRTKEAYQRMVDRLTPSGVLAVWYPAGLDPKAYLTKQYIDTFRSIGLHTNWYTNGAGILILASRDQAQSTLPDALSRLAT